MSRLEKINNLAFDLMHKEMNFTEQFVYADKIYQLSLETKLNKNQQIVFEWLITAVGNRSKDPIQMLYLLHKNVNVPGYYSKSPYREYYQLNQMEEFQILAAFAEWGMIE
ncbi:hypothetical protein [Enterococcus sp. AZ072]|uniref:hypothetical protein n=1 Tax=unclassified Enterococcus TaxID=2608891 RepID=UPI003D2D7E74